MGDADFDLFSSQAITLHPGQRLIVDTGLACDFPQDTWGMLKAKSSLTHHYGITVLGGVIDGSYQGRIKVILHNTRDTLLTIPKHAPFCQMILMPSVRCSCVRGRRFGFSARNCDAGVNRVMPHPPGMLVNGQRHGPVPGGHHR